MIDKLPTIQPRMSDQNPAVAQKLLILITKKLLILKIAGTSSDNVASNPNMRTNSIILIVAAIAILISACGTDNTTSDSPVGGGGTDNGTINPLTDGGTDNTTSDDTAGLWIDGTPKWHPTESGSGELGSSGDFEESLAYSDSSPTEALAEADDITSAGGTPPVTTIVTDQAQHRLTGGSIDDNENFDEYLAYRQSVQNLGISIRDLDPTGRIVLKVTGQNGLSIANTQVSISGDGVQVSLRTTSDGTVRFHPEAYAASAGPFTATAGDVSVQVTRGESATITTDLQPFNSDSVALDVLFLLDATGSMSDEIYQLKATIGEVANRINRLPINVDESLAMTLYRDQGDTFLTATLDFTSDIDAFADALADVQADGGGDYPEALDEALAEALTKPTWRSDSSTVQLIFLVADAPPQIAREVQVPYTDSMITAAQRGIKILPVASSGTDDTAEYVFRQLAQFTGGRYVFLTYGAAGRATGPSTDITERDYEELSLDDLIVRTIVEELESLTNTDNDPDE